MLAEGTWYLSSKSDPRWNKSGRDLVGMFMTANECAPAKDWIKTKTASLGNPPGDLVFGYMKD